MEMTNNYGPLFNIIYEVNAANTPYVRPVNIKTPSPKTIEDYGIKIGGANKDRSVRNISPSQNKKKNAYPLPSWMPRRYKVMRKEELYNEYLSERDKIGDGPFCLVNKYHTVYLHGYNSYEHLLSLLPKHMGNTVVRVAEFSEKGWCIYKKMGDERVFLKEGFKDMEEAEHYRKEHIKELVEFKFQAPALPHLTSIERKGEDYRDGKDVTVSQFCEEFGFPGIEFGNWLSQSERQKVLNFAYDAFRDLMYITGLPSNFMSLNGTLACAFGSRGKGRFLAHFEPQRFVFNLTRIKGAGSLAHEWFHAFDNYVNYLQRGKQIIRNSNGKIRHDSFEETYATEFPYANGNFPVLRDVFKELVHTMRFKNVEKESTELCIPFHDCIKRDDRMIKIRLNEVRRAFEREKSCKKNFVPATEEQKTQFEALYTRLLNHDFGKPKVYARAKSIGWHYNIFEVVEELSELVRKVTGSSFIGPNKPLSDVSAYIKDILYQEKKINETMDKPVQTIETASDFLKAAKHMDSFRQTPYWSKTMEMAARAFAAFCEDTLAEKGRMSQYLVHSAHNSIYGEHSPYPTAEERERINKAFRSLFDCVRTCFE